MRFRARVYGNYESISPPDLAATGGRVEDYQLRRADITLSGPVSDRFRFRFKGELKTGELDIRDLELHYDLGFATLKMGQLGPIDELTVPAYREFMEGTALEQAFAPPNQLGVTLLHEGENWTFATGVFKSALEPDKNQTGQTYVSRATWAPTLQDGLALHLGGYFGLRRGDDGDATYGYAVRSLLRTGKRYVDTGEIADGDRLLGLELAAGAGSLSFESQCAAARAELVSGLESDARFDGCYASLSWFLTGETRNYGGGGFSKVRVNAPVLEGGPGAWQIGLRHDRIDLNDGAYRGGRQDGWTYALNWFLGDRVWLSANYSRTDLEFADGSAETTDGIALRLQFQYQFRW